VINLPLSWCLTPIERIIESLNYGTSKKCSYVTNGVPVLRIPNIGNGIIEQSDLKYADLTEKEFEQLRLIPGDILVIRSNGSVSLVGRSAVVRESEIDFAYAGYIIRLRPNNLLLDSNYLNLCLSSHKVRLQIEVPAKSTSGVHNINSQELKQIKVPLPPLNEQHRIVAKIEALKARSQRVKEELEAIPALLDQFRQSVLAAAFRGDLTADWREKNPDITWESTTLEKVIKDKPRNGYSPKAVDYPTQVKSLTLTATTSGKFKPEFFKYIDEYIDPNSYLWLQPGDILIQRSNTLDYVGSCAIYDASFGEFIYPDLMMKIQVLEEKANTNFIYYALSNAKFRGYYKEHATGTAGNMPKINQKTVMNTPINLPRLEEQQVIVYLLQALLKIADKVEQQYQEAKAHLAQLDRSILAKAFRGELVPQDPNDEPASALLERIRAEREKLDTRKKAKGKTEKKSRKAKPEAAEPEQLSLPGFE
jgi:type I restriction enzyme S subunit